MSFLKFAEIAMLGFRVDLEPASLRQAQRNAEERLPELADGGRVEDNAADLKLALAC